MMAAPITTRQFEQGVPQPRFGSGALISANARQYGVTRDRNRFLVNVLQHQAAATPLTVVINWPAAIQK